MAVDATTFRWTRNASYFFNGVIIILSCFTMAMGSRILQNIPGALTTLNPNIDPTGAGAQAEIQTTFNGGVGMIRDVANVLIASGVFALLVGFFGIYATYKDSKSMLFAYIVILTIVIIMELSAGIAWGANAPKVGASLTTTFKDNMLSYEYQATTVDSQNRLTIAPGQRMNSSAAAITALINQLQTRVGCCGYDHHGYTDFRNSPYWSVSQEPPAFCCKFIDRDQLILADLDCGRTRTPQNSWRNKGCADKINDWVYYSGGAVIGVAAGIGFVDIFGVIVASYQYVLLKQDHA